jgi:hypothetical protein
MTGLSQKLVRGTCIIGFVLATSGVGSRVAGSVIRNQVEKDYNKTMRTEQTINDETFNYRRQVADNLESIGLTGLALATLPYLFLLYKTVVTTSRLGRFP